MLTDGDPARWRSRAAACRRSPPAPVPPSIAARRPDLGRAGRARPGRRAPRALGDVDVVFPVLHGAYGEDGTIQGLLEMAGIPYVGANVFASAAAMDKEFTKKLAAVEGIPVGPYAVLRAGDDADRGRPGAARAAGVRQAGPGRVLVRHHQGARTGTTWTRRSPPPARSTRRCWSRRRSSAARSSAACSKARRAAPRRRRCWPRSGS